MTLVNSADQSRVTRIASYTSTNPAKYGSFIAPLQLQTLPQAQKIYNKLATSTNIGVPNTNTSPKVIIKYSNVFFERGLVNTTMSNLVVKGNEITQADGQSSQNEIAYGQGKAYIRISPFDNYYKFTFYQQSPLGNTQLIDLETSGTYYIVFINNSNKKVSAPTIDNRNISNPAKGELAFKVSETLSTEILQYTNRNFYITNRPPASSDPDIIQEQIPTGGAAKDALAKKSTSLNDSSRDIILAAKQINEGLLSNAVTVSANSSSVLYQGNWLKEGEAIPTTGATGATASNRNSTTVPQVTDPTSFNPNILINPGLISEVPVTSSWQILGPVELGATGSQVVSLNNPNIFATNTGISSAPKLTPVELQSAVSADVRGKIALNWTTYDIISYFLDPTQPGYKLYVGLTKATFTEAVKGIFDASALLILYTYGNTGNGITNGGPGAEKGSTTNQTGTDDKSRKEERQERRDERRDDRRERRDERRERRRNR